VLELRHAAGERVGIGGHDLPDEIEVTDAHRRKDVMARATPDEQRHQLARTRRELVGWLVVFVEDGGPADHLHLVDVADTVNVATGIEESTRDLDVSGGRRPVERIGVVALFARVGIGALLEQTPDVVEPAVSRGGVQFRPVGWSRLRIHDRALRFGILR
jgi:hypothetical protein